MNEKEQLIEIFEKNIRGKKPDISKSNQRLDGKYGHWLERQFGITSNRENQADILGYELKNQTSSKTTFGDWSPNYFIYKDKDYSHIFTGKTFAEKQNQFVRLFGKSNIKKKRTIFLVGSSGTETRSLQ